MKRSFYAEHLIPFSHSGLLTHKALPFHPGTRPRLSQDAEKHNFSPEDLQIALNHCSERAPVPWLLDNLDSMIETVCTLATNYGHERPENDVGGWPEQGRGY